jgi:hypothetical protein
VPKVSDHPDDRLIRELIITHRSATPEEVERITARIAGANFDPEKVRVPGKYRGLHYRGRTVQARDDSLFVHLVERVVADRQWRLGVTAQEYLLDLREAARHPSAGVMAYNRHGINFAAVLAPNTAPAHRLGPDAKAMLFVAYSADSATIRTGYQVGDFGELNIPGDRLWLR